MSELEQRRTLPAAACAHALHIGCPHAPLARTDGAHPRSHWLRLTCAIACRCTARFRALLVLAGWAGIAGFCAASTGFFAGALNEAQYLAGVASAMGLFATSVLIAHLGDPYELARMECQRRVSLHTIRRVESRTVARSPRTTMTRLTRAALPSIRARDAGAAQRGPLFPR